MSMILLKKNKQKSKSKSEAAVKKCRERRWHQWKNTFDCFDLFTEVLNNSTEQSRIFEENRLLIFAIKSYLKRELEKNVREVGDHMTINWSVIESDVATDFHVRREDIISN